MEASRVIELLDEGRNANWSEYAKSGKSREKTKIGKDAQDNNLMCVTFYILCKCLIQAQDHHTPSEHLDKYISEELESVGTPKENPRSNRGSWFTQQYTQFVGKKPNHFRPEWAEVVHREDPEGAYQYVLNPKYIETVNRYFGQEPPSMNDHHDRRGESQTRQGSELIKLGEDLFWNPPDKMEEVAKLLLDPKKRQLIFYGPPGTGKTFVARALAKHLIGDEKPEEFSRFLQFHPSYSYEDFFEGYRPVKSENGGMPQFELVSGPLKELAEHAGQSEHSKKPHVLVIDEINRGNLAKIFGELYFLLEYRDEAIRLQYGGTPFSLPENLLIIGTMNTADRSNSHIDAALRRRFHFFPLFPDEEPNKGLLERYLAEKHADKQLEWVAKVVDSANQKLNCRDSSIGHSHFIRNDLDKTWVELIWEYSIMPLIEDRFIDQPDKVKEFKLDRLREGLPLEVA